MRRWSYFAAVSIVFVLVISLAGASENLVDVSKKVTALEREIIDFKMARADSWTFWMAVFMSMVLIIMAMVGFIIPFLVNQSVKEVRNNVEEDKKLVQEMKEEVGRHLRDTRSMKQESAEITEMLRGHAIKPGSETQDTPTNHDIIMKIQKAEALQDRGELTKAEETWQAIADHSEADDQDRFISLLRIAELNSPPTGKTPEAIEKAESAFSEAEKIFPNHMALLNNRGLLFFYTKHFDKALAQFSKIIELGAMDFSTYANRSNTFVAQQNFEAGRDDMLNALEIWPEDIAKSTAYVRLGVCDFELGNIADAFKYFELAKVEALEDEREDIEGNIRRYLEEKKLS